MRTLYTTPTLPRLSTLEMQPETGVTSVPVRVELYRNNAAGIHVHCCATSLLISDLQPVFTRGAELDSQEHDLHFYLEPKKKKKKWCLRLRFCTVRLFWPRTSWAHEMKFGMSHATNVGSMARLLDMQSSVLRLISSWT